MSDHTSMNEACRIAVFRFLQRTEGLLTAMRWLVWREIMRCGLTFHEVARRIGRRPGTVAKWLSDGDRAINMIDPISDMLLACGAYLEVRAHPS